MFEASVYPAHDPVQGGGKEVAGRAPSTRSAVYVNGRATRNALRRLPTRLDRRIVHHFEDLPLGAHLLTPRRGYTHHGIYVGNGKVVHYAGLCRSLARGPVEEVSLEEFADGQAVHVKIGASALYSAAVIIERARSRLGENRYRITTNNCEHFCEWCLRGEPRSEQVERLLAWPRKVARRAYRFVEQLIGPRPAPAQTALVPVKILSSGR